MLAVPNTVSIWKSVACDSFPWRQCFDGGWKHHQVLIDLLKYVKWCGGWGGFLAWHTNTWKNGGGVQADLISILKDADVVKTLKLSCSFHLPEGGCFYVLRRFMRGSSCKLLTYNFHPDMIKSPYSGGRMKMLPPCTVSIQMCQDNVITWNISMFTLNQNIFEASKVILHSKIPSSWSWVPACVFILKWGRSHCSLIKV